ncbi:MAG: YjbH domain-containing protein [Pseudomonadota bacterium]
MFREKLILGAAASALVMSGPATADMDPSIGFYGTAGLIEMPTADMLPDAELSISYSEFANAENIAVGFQFLPQLSMTYRIQRLSSFGFDGGSRYDGIWDINYQILPEGEYAPAVLIGLRDFLGTGETAGQYIVATKTIADQLKLSVGVGWGRLGDTDEDQTDPDISGGSLRLDEYFTGDTAVFGGVEWKTPIKGVSLKAEYSSDRYFQENEAFIATNPPAFDRKSDWNYGLEWQTPLSLNVGIYQMYGDTVGVRIATSLNPRRPRPQGYIVPAPLPVQPRDQAARSDLSWLERPNVETVAANALRRTLAQDGIRVTKIKLTGRQVDIYVTGGRSIAAARTFGRVARALTYVMPESVETFVIGINNAGMETVTMKINRTQFEAFELSPDGVQQSARSFELGDAPLNPPGFTAFPGDFPRFRWSIRPYLNITLFSDGDQPDVNVGLSGSMSYQTSEKLRFQTTVRVPVIDGDSDSGDNAGPNESIYFTEFEPTLVNLRGTYTTKLGEQLYGTVSAGLLATKWAGIAGEIIWKPAAQRWGVGFEVGHVVRRDQDTFFELEDEDATTGHLTYYYDARNGFDYEVSAGRYLAGDWGTTVAVDRAFDNGWVVGLFATVTDLTAEEFGSGRFQKGFRIAIPLGWAIGTQTRRVIGSSIASTSGEGGSKLGIPGNLYGSVTSHQTDAVSGTWGTFWQ